VGSSHFIVLHFPWECTCSLSPKSECLFMEMKVMTSTFIQLATGWKPHLLLMSTSQHWCYWSIVWGILELGTSMSDPLDKNVGTFINVFFHYFSIWKNLKVRWVSLISRQRCGILVAYSDSIKSWTNWYFHVCWKKEWMTLEKVTRWHYLYRLV